MLRHCMHNENVHRFHEIESNIGNAICNAIVRALYCNAWILQPVCLLTLLHIAIRKLGKQNTTLKNLVSKQTVLNSSHTSC